MIYSKKQLTELITPIAEKYRIPSVYLFGSYARGSATENSDIDLLIDTHGTKLTSLFQLSALLLEPEEATGKQVDLVTESSLEQKTNRLSTLHFQEAVRRERMKLYAAR